MDASGRRLVLAAVAVASLAGAASAAQAAAAAPSKGWVGEVKGTRAFVGVTMRRQTVTAYVCDGRGVARWYRGLLRAGRAVLRDEHSRRLVLRIAGSRATGSLALPGHRHATFAAVAARGRAGTFRREASTTSSPSAAPRRTSTGWVRLNDGRTKGLALTQTVRVVRPLPLLKVFLRPLPTTTVTAPASAPLLSERVVPATRSGPCVTVPRQPVAGHTTPPFASGPTCGLPAAGMKIGVRKTSTRVLRRPPGTAISDAALARLLADLPRVTAREQARLVTAAGLGSLPPGLPTAEQQARLDEVAQALVDDPQVTAAAEAYRLAPDETHFKVLGSFLGKYLDPILGLVDRPEIALAEESAEGTFNPTTEATLTGPWTTIEDDDLDGPDAEVGPSKESVFLGNAIDVGTFARAGFQSSAKITTYAILDIVVPPGVQEVEVHPIATRRGEMMVQPGCFEGFGYSALDRSLWLTARNADGTFHVFEDRPSTASTSPRTSSTPATPSLRARRSRSRLRYPPCRC